MLNPILNLAATNKAAQECSLEHRDSWTELPAGLFRPLLPVVNSGRAAS